MPSSPPFIPTFIFSQDSELDVLASRPPGRSDKTADMPYEEGVHMVDSIVAGRTLESFQWVRGEELPLEMSLYLVGLLLPYRAHFHFLVPIPYLVHHFPLPPSDPASIHPCLRNACHLAACSVIGGRWSSLEPYFAAKTRAFLDKVLMLPTPEHIIHFLWASILLASYLMRERRVEESFTTIASACSISSAFGLLSTYNLEYFKEHHPGHPLLPAPTTEAEALHRIWLLHSIYLTDHSLSALTGLPPSSRCEEWTMPSLENGKIVFHGFKIPMVADDELRKVWESDVHRSAFAMHIFKRASALVLVDYQKSPTRYQSDLDYLMRFIRALSSEIPPLSSMTHDSKPAVFLSNSVLYGSLLVIHSIRAGNDADERREMLRCVRDLVEICVKFRSYGSIRRIQSSFVPVIHMMNAVRVLAHELQKPDVEENPRLCSEYCHSIEIVLDFIDEVITSFPAWSTSLESIKDVLISAINSLTL
ncbi:hypothetical protein DL93DRAFT_2229250 [Clavulina sp. PMI_390]|nr:hypothetical protein DL93DRAFT_2229250 [Clavulina sp. PMI_390]